MFPNSVGGMGMNHAGWHIDDWKEAGWGMENYNVLLELKKKWDPHNRFWCRHCVGSDESESLLKKNWKKLSDLPR